MQDGSFHAVAFSKPVTIRQSENTVIFYDTSPADFDSIWKPYFDLERDYDAILQGFSPDKYLRKASELYRGIRILRQETWEALCSFILSQNNNIPRIKGIISRLCACFGEKVGPGDYAFPSPERLAGLCEEDLSPLRSGFRAKYILDAAQKVVSGEINLNSLAVLPLEQARSELMKIKGVGPKVAECVLLYGCGRVDAFPVDVWVKRIMQELYPDGLPACTRHVEGIAQQYLFHWRRNQKENAVLQI